MLYQMIIQDAGRVCVEHVCAGLGVSRSGYYRWMTGMDVPLQDPGDMRLRDEMHKIACEFVRYGYRRMTHELRRRGFSVNHKRVLKLMSEDNLLCLKKVFKPRTTNSDHNYRIYPNLAKGLKVTGLNQLWVADITYIRLQTEFVYLAVVMDVYSRRCLGWELSRNIDTQLTLQALENALEDRQDMDLAQFIHHSDRGVQYAATDYVNRLQKHKIQISMSRTGNPYDNAFAESLMKTLKYEEVYLNEYDDLADAHKNIKRFLEDVYNTKRLHSSIGYLPPNEFEKEVIYKP